MYEDELYHYGKIGMKWGVRKSRPKSSSSRKRTSKSSKKTNATRKKVLTDSRKETLKKVAKTTAKVAGTVAATAILGSVGAMAFNEISKSLAPAIEGLKSEHYKQQSLDSLKKGNLGDAFSNAGKSFDSYSRSREGQQTINELNSRLDDLDKAMKRARGQ